jgi:hypothetical protein
MITSAFIYIIALLLGVVADGLAIIPLAIPTNFKDSVAYFAGYLNYAGGLIDIPGVMAALLFFVNFMIAWYTFKVILWVWHLLFTAKQGQPIAAQEKKTK